MKNNINIEGVVTRFIVEIIDCDIFKDDDIEVLPKSKLKDLGMDSLDRVELLLKVEEYFNIHIDNEDQFYNCVTVIDCCQYIKNILPKTTPEKEYEKLLKSGVKCKCCGVKLSDDQILSHRLIGIINEKDMMCQMDWMRAGMSSNYFTDI